MQPIQRNEVLPIGDYEALRERFRARIIEAKRVRRIKLGDHISAVFENRDSVLLQIQEMLRTERITNEAGIKHEIDTYNELVPSAEELSITLFVEIPDRALRDEMLVKLKGLEDSVFVEIDGTRFAPIAQPRDGASADRTTAVHYFKFPVGADAAARLAKGDAALLVDHPQYQAREVLTPETLRSLADDFANP